MTRGEIGWKPLTQEGEVITKQGPGANETLRKQDKRPRKSPRNNEHMKGPSRNGLPGARAVNMTPIPHERTPSMSEPHVREGPCWPTWPKTEIGERDQVNPNCELWREPRVEDDKLIDDSESGQAGPTKCQISR
ncbi:hypothetical protein R1flu_016206 [Riccia fluitans]|uniref:Uncharacterized protein n=1 Tax=Riccia fluitans TaxID=41844 RepID=A0ABD1YLE0_9MARC